jgi:hypothetical protein
MRILTLRGVCSANSVEKIMSFDSAAVGYGWKVLDFRIMTNDATAVAAGKYQAGAAIGSSSEQFTFNDWDESQMIGLVNVSDENNVNTLLDYNHVIVQNLYLSNLSPTAAVNYIVVLEPMNITPQENIMFMLKERAQT